MSEGITESGKVSDLFGWQNTRWGMTEAELINAIGTDVLRRIDRAIYAGTYADIVIPSVNVIGFQFQITFQMDATTDRLSQVLIKHTSLDPDQEPIAAFKAARTALTEKFGTPEREGTSDILQWVFPTTTIDLQLFHLADIMSEVAIRYLPTSKAVCSKSLSAF